MKFFADINLNQNELQNAVIHVVANTSAITTPVEGQIIYDQSASLIKYYDGSAWVSANAAAFSLAGDTGTSTLQTGETLRFIGGTNLTSVVNTSDQVIFNLNDAITVATSISTPTVNATDINAVTATFTTTNSPTVNATDVNAVTVSTTTVSATTGNIFTVNATDVNSVTVDATTVSATTGNVFTLNSTDVNSVTVDAATVSATTGNIATVNSTDVNSVTVDATTVNATTVAATTGNIATVNATDVNSVTVDATTVSATTGNISTVNSTDVNSVTVDATTITGTTGNITTVNSTTTNTFNVNATDVTSVTINGESGGIGTVVFYATDTLVNSSLTVASDLTVLGTISGDIAAGDITGTLFTITDGSTPEAITAGETITFAGATNELDVTQSAGTVTFGIVTNPTLSGDVTITGDLTVQGTTTTVDSITITVKDPIISLNSGLGASANTNDIGIVGERGSTGDNIALFWDEDTDTFVAGFTTASGSDIQVLPLTGYADFIAADITAASDVTIGGQIVSYGGSAPTTGQILIGDGAGFEKGTITTTSTTGITVSTATPNTINLAIDIDSATDGTGITIAGTDKLLLSDAGAEKRINASQLGDLFLTRNTAQTLSTSDQMQVRENISAVELVKSTITGTGSTITRYIPHNIGSTDVVVQIFDADGVQVFADVDTTVGTGGNLGNYISVTGNFENAVVYKVVIMGTRGAPISVTAETSTPA